MFGSGHVSRPLWLEFPSEHGGCGSRLVDGAVLSSLGCVMDSRSLVGSFPLFEELYPMFSSGEIKELSTSFVRLHFSTHC